MQRTVELQELSKNTATISRLFSRSVIHELSSDKVPTTLRRVIKQSGLLDLLTHACLLRRCYETAYQIIDKRYRNEYFYKNTLANRILLGRHSLKTASMITEFRVGETKADVVILNGTSNIYEIKTEFDNLVRLEKQISNYRRVFEHIYVVTCEGHQHKVLEVLGSDIGVLTIDHRHNLKTFRKSVSQLGNLDSSAIFDVLQKQDYLSIILQVFGEIPKVPNTQIYRECKRIFARIDPQVAHKYMVDALRHRSPRSTLTALLSEIPPALVAAVISYGHSKREAAVFSSALNRPLTCFL